MQKIARIRRNVSRARRSRLRLTFSPNIPLSSARRSVPGGGGGGLASLAETPEPDLFGGRFGTLEAAARDFRWPSTNPIPAIERGQFLRHRRLDVGACDPSCSANLIVVWRTSPQRGETLSRDSVQASVCFMERRIVSAWRRCWTLAAEAPGRSCAVCGAKARSKRYTMCIYIYIYIDIDI